MSKNLFMKNLLLLAPYGTIGTTIAALILAGVGAHIAPIEREIMASAYTISGALIGMLIGVSITAMFASIKSWLERHWGTRPNGIL